MNKIRMIICLSNQIHVYDLIKISCLVVLTTSLNPNGLCALASFSGSYLCFPDGNDGNVVMYDSLGLRLVNEIAAHKNPIIAMEFNR